MTQFLWNIQNEFSQMLERWWWHLFWLQILISLPVWAKWPFFGSFFHANGVFGIWFILANWFSKMQISTQSQILKFGNCVLAFSQRFMTRFLSNLVWRWLSIYSTVWHSSQWRYLHLPILANFFVKLGEIKYTPSMSWFVEAQAKSVLHNQYSKEINLFVCFYRIYL